MQLRQVLAETTFQVIEQIGFVINDPEARRGFHDKVDDPRDHAPLFVECQKRQFRRDSLRPQFVA